MNEFEIIEKYFAPLCPLGITDDAAVLQIPDGHELIVTTDTLNAGTHFMENASAADIAHKALRVNLSDLAAMGAKPYAYQLALASPENPGARWLEGFTGALHELQEEFGIFCSGGDTTSIKGALSISITAMGIVPKGRAVKRSGAQPGDLILLSDTIGDAYVGLQILQNKIDSANDDYFIERYYRPRPRLDLARMMQGYANAAIDVSDGLPADLAHICKASNVSADIYLKKIPFSAQARKTNIPAEMLLSGGDDYALILAVPPENLKHFGGLHVVGEFKEGAGVAVLDERGAPVELSHTGWSHF